MTLEGLIETAVEYRMGGAPEIAYESILAGIAAKAGVSHEEARAMVDEEYQKAQDAIDANLEAAYEAWVESALMEHCNLVDEGH